MTAFTIAIARAMGLPREQINTIARGAFLHDIGKMAIPDKILNKPGKLDADEIDIMREHAYHGYQIVKKIPFLAEAAEIVYSHQEQFRWHRLSARAERERKFRLGRESFPLPIPSMPSLRTESIGRRSSSGSARGNRKNGPAGNLIRKSSKVFLRCRTRFGTTCAQ